MERAMYKTKTLEGYQSLDGIEVYNHPYVIRRRKSSETLEDYCKYIYMQEAREKRINKPKWLAKPINVL